MAVRTTLLQHENEQLKEALVNEKKRRQRGKPLLLEAPQEYHGGVVFWSPSKQKALEAERRKAAKQEKAEMLEERRRIRVAAKELRIQQQQKKAAERKEAQIARAAEKQLRQDIQLSKKRSIRSKKVPAPPPDVIEEPEVLDVDVASIRERLAYATFLAGTQARIDNLTISEKTFHSDKYFTATRLLGYHLMHKSSTRTRRNIPFVVMVTQTVPDIQIKRLEKDGATVVKVEPQPTGDWFHPQKARWNDVMTKLRLWELEQFNRVLFLDVDNALFSPLDGVFDDPGARMVESGEDVGSPQDAETESEVPKTYLMASAPECKARHNFPPSDADYLHGPDYFNAGFFMFSPSNLLHAHYSSLASNSSANKFQTDYPEQNLLNYAHRRDGPMPWTTLDGKWNIVYGNQDDVDKGLVSVHMKWWNGLDLEQWFEKEVAGMEAFYLERDEVVP
ncbi:nucleotide-diphospho-sugar transferase [Byssothecium circinans]|uniref:Nucleotide-diphospho-sugar transferase n=1 Tax=Byssothecium circinans TaxID=147558 RepID=A0A6A5UC52_9PLEO|nr:nucleotide-diphospho-sugar transferase [Byssothecium circinans]